MLTFSKYRPYIALGSAMDMSFIDFFVYNGKPGMFFAVELGAILSALILAVLFRKEKAPVEKSTTRTEVNDYVPTILLVGLFLVIGGISNMGVIDALAGLLTKLGGNMTPIGASANITGIGILRKNGYTVKNSDFFKIGISFTFAAIIPAYIFPAHNEISHDKSHGIFY